MRRETVFVTLSVCITIVAASAIIAQGGPLDPPQGPILPSYKTLDEVEPRIPITELPFSINESGSYYLTANLTGAGGINVNAPGVTIDLMGHTLTRLGGQSPIAIEGSDTAAGLLVRNGRITGWNTGVAVEDTGDITLENLRIDDIVGEGVIITDRARIIGCVVRDCGTTGIAVGPESHIDNVTVSGCVGDGVDVGADSTVDRLDVSTSGCAGLVTGPGTRITDTRATGNGDQGIDASFDCVLTRCVARLNAGNEAIRALPGSILIDCLASENTFIGIQSTKSTLTGCVATNNGSIGFSISSSNATRCVARENGNDGFFAIGAVLRHCLSISNDGLGVDSAAIVDQCSIQNNSQGGILATGSNGEFRGNLISGSSIGIDATSFFGEIIDNHFLNCKIGIDAKSASSCLITGNRFNSLSVPQPIAIDAGEAFGPFIDVVDVGDISAIPLTDHPDANLVY